MAPPADPFEITDSAPADPQPARRAVASMAHLDGLNEEQRQAVIHQGGPLLVLAGAGTGKTRVLTTRIAHLLITGRARPSQILAVTFTNKAAREMLDRVAALIGGAADGMWLGTFHAIGVRVLRRHAELVGLKSNFTILDTDDQTRLIKQLLQADNIDDKKWPARVLSGIIQRWKDRALSPDKVSGDDAGDFANGRAAEIYRQYQVRLAEVNAVDFGDLVMHCVSLWQKHADVLAQYHRRFRHILVDEYQDTNVAQYLWLRLLAQGTEDVCCVGDDDQSIYGWRGAEVGNILRFEKDFPNATIVRLERNYRSTPHILAAASHLISHNEGRLGKTLWTEMKEGERISLRGVWDGDEEARTIGEEIEALQRDKHALSQIAILVRAGFQTREFEERFITMGLPYRVIGGPRFYERQEIRDALKPAARKALASFLADLARWRGLDVAHPMLAQIVLDESGYTAMWQQDKSADAPGRLENLKELVTAMAEFENLTGFLEHVGLVMENTAEAGADMVSLMTLHSAKGLEFDSVFLPGWEEGLFPSQRSMDENGLAGLEEERRLAYVGITRARHRAAISFAANRRIHGSWQGAIASRFVGELPPDHVEILAEPGLAPHMGAAWGSGSQFSELARPDFTRREFGLRESGYRRPTLIEGRGIPVRGAEVTHVGGFAPGDRVFHQKFGYGTVRAVDENKLAIAFDKAGDKKVMDSFVAKA